MIERRSSMQPQDSSAQLAHEREGDFAPSVVRTTLNRQRKGNHVCCGYCGKHIGNLSQGEHHHIFGIGQAKQSGILSDVLEDIRSSDNDVFVHRAGCHSHLNDMQEKGVLYPEVMRREGKLRILHLLGPRTYFNGEDWVEIRSAGQTRHRGLHPMQFAFR